MKWFQPLVVLLTGSLCLAAGDGTKTATFTMSAAEKELLDLTNQERKKEDLPPLRPSPLLFKAAREHSANMAQQGKMEHVLDGKTPFMRIKATGYRYQRAGENIAKGGARDVSLPGVMKGWMDSKPHRANILNPHYTEIGLGRVVGEDGYAYYTQVFAKPLK